MTRRPALATLCILALLACPPGAGAQATAPGDRSRDEAAIRAHIESIFQAFIDKDLPKLEATHGAEWRGFTTGSRRVIRGRDGYMKSATGGAHGPKGQGMIGYRMSDFDVVFYGDTAVASFVADLDIVSGGERRTSKLNLVDVYHHGPDGWIQVASNTSHHPDAVLQQMSTLRPLPDAEKARLLEAREAVWRAWYSGDVAALGRLVPPELVTLGSSADAWGTRESILAASTRFASGGSKLTRLAFPRTEIQAYGATAIIYTSYELDVERDGATKTERGLATEVFVFQDGRWVNTGWQLAPIGAT
jgi:ketosteroid isomerase-like protein